ncbi:hypothetical protein [Psychrobacillus sp. FJAT-21963]|uniref:hypothetical protein n=1 Tax=Psychrobacillus sp. FJAT-21963 TaxID=1712028 RepID=UPI0006F225C4|nr:hypothetical protein [Psychrobacillus sp. FJAT-21963]KQL35498.1 hypothetical protein AN959_06225 [Psychrobacillus sp. FJAT-21963]
MSSTSFSSIQAQQTKILSPNMQTSIKEGQVVHGTIKKLYPNQTAELQIGNQKVIAKLETPLKAGDAHFFQVTKTEPELQLKVVTGPLTNGNTLAQQAQQLLQAMNLTKTTEMQAVIQFFLKEQLPISKEILVQAEQLLKQLPPNVSIKQAMETIQKMLDLKIPLSQQMFDAVLSGKSTSGLQSLIQEFKLTLQQDLTLSKNDKNTLLQSLQKLAEPFGEPVAGVLLGKQIEVLQSPVANLATKLPILQSLKEAGVLSPNVTLNNLLPASTLSTMPNSAADIIANLLKAPVSEKSMVMDQIRNWVSAQPLLTSEQKVQLGILLNNNSQAEQILTLNKTLLEVFAKQSQEAVFLKDQHGLTAKEHLLSLLGKGTNKEMVSQTLQQVLSNNKNSQQPIFSTALQQAEQNVLQQLDGKAFEHAMKEALKSLGFSYEAKLGGGSEEVRQLASQLKPQLIDLLHNQVISAPLKEQAELLLNRMNGLQILSNENGPQHQLLMQVPLEFLGKKMDATLEWNGRMKEDGKIDSDYARIMFYLHLDSLEETVVDMQVQNRVVTISLYNNDISLKPIANVFYDTLKEGLLSVGYQLSGVFVKTFEENKLTSPKKLLGKESQGVDIRI